MLTEGVGQGTQAAFEIHLEEVQETDLSLALDLQYKGTNRIQTSYLKSEDSDNSNGCCYGPKFHKKVQLLNSSYLNGHTLGFHTQTQKLEPPCAAQ